MTQRQATAADLLSVLRLSMPGDEVLFSGALNVKGLAISVPDPGVRVIAAPGATLGGWSDQPILSGVTFAGFHINPGAGVAGLGICSTAAGWFALEDCTLGGEEIALGDGIVIMGCGVVRRLKARNLTGAISVQSGHDVLIEECEFSGLAGDAIAAGLVGGAIIRRNRFTGFRNEAAHRDCIQVLKGDTRGGVILIEGNVYDRGDVASTAAQGVFTDGAPGPIVIRGNAFYGGPWQTIAIYGAQPGTVIEDNFCQGIADANNYTPWIKTTGTGEGVTVARNVTVSPIDAPGAIQTGNSRILNAKPGDRTALNAWQALRDAGQLPAPPAPPAPAPTPQPAPVPAPAPPPPAADPRDAIIAAMTAAGLKALADVHTLADAALAQVGKDSAALASIASLAAAGRKLTSATAMRPFLDQIAALAAS